MNEQGKPRARRLPIALLLPLIALTGAACSSLEAADHWVDNQWIVQDREYPPETLAIGARRAETSGAVAVAPRSAALSLDQRDALVRFVARSGAGKGDSAVISLSPAGGRPLAERRVAVIAAILHRQGLSVTRSFGPEPAPHLATVTVARVIATGPNCPEWDRLMKRNQVDEYKVRFGCLNAASLAASVHRPQDLVAPRALGPSDAQILEKGLQNYREGKIDAKPDAPGSGTSLSGSK